MVDEKGNMYIDDSDIVELMLANRRVKILPKNISSFEKFSFECRHYGLDIPFEVASNNLKDWNMPIEYKTLDVKKHILNNKQLTSDQITRLDLELAEYRKRDLLDLLRFLIYFVQVIRTNNIVYGVGRGSSVSSYVLYLIGIHRVDSFKFNLDIKEFLR